MKLLYKHDYLVEVQEESDGCTILTPERFLDYFVPSDIRGYSIIQDEKRTGIEIDSLLDGVHFYPVPAYAIHTLILSEIQLYCNILDFDVKYIKYTNLEGKNSNELVLSEKIKLTEREKELKGILEHIFIRQTENKFAEDVTKEIKLMGVEEGYRILEDFYRSIEDGE